MNLTTLIQKKETLFNNKKFTKALDDTLTINIDSTES